ncbi:beta-eliminating lyase-related protein [Flavobacteriaceae bacterium F08102]|nr:beta-eliminating lyase-related protein [Flavobacteriaceae bacterium F08102]
MKKINLLSDTVTKPTAGMLKFMMAAEVGDDVFQADPTVLELQQKAADLFGMEAALFFPSGTMANQVAIKIHTQPGDQVICDHWAHIYNYEGGGVAANSGVTSKLIVGDRGMFTADQVLENLSNSTDIHQPTTSLVAVENTANKGGGACWSMDELKRIQQVCKKESIYFHLDGARLFNALVAKNETPSQYGALFDTISICLSKGLGCPVGSLLLGTHEAISKALRIRKRMGGGMRQVGYLAAAGIYALDHHVARLAEDHIHATLLAQSLKEQSWVKKVEKVETNIVIFYVQDTLDPAFCVEKLAEKGVLLVGMGQGKLRMVTHLDISRHDIECVIDIIKKMEF